MNSNSSQASTNASIIFPLLVDHLHQLMDLGPKEVAVCSVYVLLTWVYDLFPMVPILRAIAPFSSGKTRLIEGVLMPLVYCPFKTEGGSPTPANLRRTMMDQHREGLATLIVEDVGFDVEPRTEPADLLINRCRQGGSASYQAPDGHGGYRQIREVIFGPTMLGSRVAFSDVAVESRILDIDLAAQDRTDRVLPDPPWKDKEPDHLVALLANFRQQILSAPNPNKLPRIQGVEDRIWDVGWPLVWLTDTCQDPGAMELVVEFLRLRSEALADDKGEEPVVMVIGALVAISIQSGKIPANPPSILLSEIRDHIYQTSRAQISSRQIGKLCRSPLNLVVFTSSGQKKVRSIDWAQLRQIGARFGFKDELLESQYGGPEK